MRGRFSRRLLLSCAAASVALSRTACASLDEAPIGVIAVEATGEKEQTQGPESESDDPPIQLEDIIVTADKRVTTQRDLPGSVGVVGGGDLDAMHAQGLKDYLKLIPGVTFNDQGTESSVPEIRGVATSIGFGATAQAAGVYLDDMPFTDLYAPLSIPDVSPFDLERVEVLKGPQGTLFGSGALAGAVRYITQKPRFGMWEAKLSETWSQTKESRGTSWTSTGAINIPIGDAAAIRAVGVLRHEIGLYDASAANSRGDSLREDSDADRKKQRSVRVLASWRPTERLNASGFYLDQRSHADDTSLADQSQALETSRAPFASPNDHDFTGGNLLISYDFDWGRLLSSSNRMTKRNSIFSDGEWFFDLQKQNLLQFYDLTIGKVRGFTQEVRLSSHERDDSSTRWLIGAAYMRYKQAYFDYEPLPQPAGTAQPSAPGDLSTTQRATSFLFATIDSDAREQALFGEISQRLGQRFELTVGARWYKMRMPADTDLSGAQVVALVMKPEDQEHFDLRSSGVNPKFAIHYLFNRNLQLYALATRGFQFGGVQVNPSSPVLVQSAAQAGYSFGPYKSSSLWSYEVGLRTEWWRRRLRFDVDAFYVDWKDLQLTVRSPILGTQASFNVIANVGSAHSEGVEAAFEVIPFSGAKWTSSAAWVSALTDEDFDPDNAAGPVKAGTRLPGSPKFQWSNVVSYEHPLGGGWTFGPVLTHTRIGGAPDAIRPTGSVGGYDAFDARVALASKTRVGVEFSAGLNNFTNVHAVTYHSQMASAVKGTVNDFYHFLPPRTFIATISLRY